jgi:flagellar hook-associated protein 2
MAIIATGVGSGLDIEGLVASLMAAERAPLTQRLTRQEASITSDVSGLGTLKSVASDLQAALASVNSLDTYLTTLATSTDVTAVRATSSSQAATGSYSVSVDTLATAQSLAVRHQFSSLLEELGTGTLTFTFGTTDYTPHAGSPVNNANDTYDDFTARAGVASQSVTIDSSNNTLAGVRDAINAADIGLSAAIVSDGENYRLLFSSDDTGANNSFEIAVSDSGDSNHTDTNGLSRLAFNKAAGTGSVYQTVAASDANFSVNGLSLSSESNTASNVIEGVDLTLKAITSSAVTVDVADNSLGVKAGITAFVNGFNAFTKSVDTLTSYDAVTGVSGPLQGDFTARSMVSRLRSTLGLPADGWTGANTRLAEIGISFSSKGQLIVDDKKLSAALASGVDQVAGVLTRFARGGSGSGLAVASFTKSVPKGDYVVAASSLATNGKIAATVPGAAFPLTIDASTDQFILTVDGTASGEITLARQNYADLSAIAAELQTKINLDSTLRAGGKSVTVSVSGNEIEIRSNTLGSASSVAVANSGGDATVARLGLASPTTTGGSDLVGTINGVAGVAAGNVLTGAVGTDAAGLLINVKSTTGGTVKLSDGVVNQVDSLLTALLGIDNPIDSRIESLTARAAGIAEERVQMERRLASVEARYRRQFNALDTLLNQVSSTGSFVTQQLAMIPVPGQSNK